MPADDLFGDLPPRQLEALSIRFGEGSQPTPYRQIADRMGVSPMMAHKLVRRGCRRMAAVGVDLARLFGGAS